MKAQADCRRRKKSVKWQQQHKDKKMQLSAINVQNRKLFCPGTSRDRGVCPGTFAPALVPGQRDTGTRKFLCPAKGQRDIPEPAKDCKTPGFKLYPFLTLYS